ncbi:MAG TPA: hypothetical protein VNA29_03005 [Sphingomicrobium sp.]|nr:hypothetical protein [Sphingomicrobium sp.]
MEVSSSTLALGTQLLVSAGLVFVMTLLHSLGLLGIGKLLHLDPDILRRRKVDHKAIVTLASLGLLIFALHIAEIFMFAGFYLKIGALEEFDQALYFSASAYTTLGLTADFPDRWRLIGSVEALIGFVLIGWSTAFMIGTMDRLRTGPTQTRD